MKEKQAYLEQNLDGVRQALVCQADDADLIGVLVTEPASPEADVGIIYFVRQGYWSMCGSGTFALGVLLLESRVIEPTEPVTEITLDLASGLMKLSVDTENRRVGQVKTRTAPVFHWGSEEIELSGYGRVPVDIAYCLNGFEPLVDARKLGLGVTLENRRELECLGLEIRDRVNQTFELRHPSDQAIGRAVQVQLYDSEPEAAGVDCRCVAIYGVGGFDLTPSGTSTCAHMAVKRARGELSVGDHFVMESVTGAIIRGRIAADTKLGETDAIIPEIAGNATVLRALTLFR